MTSKIFFSDKYIVTLLSAILLSFSIASAIFIYGKNLERKNVKLQQQLNEMQALNKDLIYIKDIVESKEKKIGLTNVSGVVPALEQTLNSLGLKAKVIKPLEKRKVKDFTEEDAELEIEGLDLNKLVNLFYKIENSPMPLKVKTANIKTTFENPNVFVLSITASLISR